MELKSFRLILTHAITIFLTALTVTWMHSAPAEQMVYKHLQDAVSLSLSGPEVPQRCEKATQQPACDNSLSRMRWIAKPAACRVKGHLIEALDSEMHFRRGYALRFSDNVEDRTSLLPWLLATKENLNAAKRRIYIDFGANTFSSSVQWFLDYYPVDFTEMHVFEVQPNLFQLPANPMEASDIPAPLNNQARKTSKRPTASSCDISIVKMYNSFVDREDGPNRVGATRFIKETLGVKPEDTLVLKMDIEGGEWPILTQWLDDPEMPRLLDEIFVEVHYKHEEMYAFGGWDRFPNTIEQTTKLLEDLRAKDFYIHAWP